MADCDHPYFYDFPQAQHRMRPEICSLLVPTIYQDLVNHDSVLSYPNVRGMAKNLFFVKHSEPEKTVRLFVYLTLLP